MDQVLATENSSEKRKRAKKIKRRYVLICIGVVLLFCGYSSCLVLQTSINVVGGLGSKVVAINFASNCLSNLSIGPLLMRIIGGKKTLIMAEISLLLFIVANFFSEPAILIIGAIIAGFAQSTFWNPICISFVYFGKKFQKYSSKSEEACVMKFSALLFGIFQFNQIVGNVFVFLILHFLRSPQTGDDVTNATSPVTQAYAESPANEVDNRLVFCGANDCQDANVTQDNIEQYVPSNPVAIYVLMGTLIAIMLSGIAIHALAFPALPLRSYNAPDAKRKENKEGEEIPLNGGSDGDVIKEENEKTSIKQIVLMFWIAFKDVVIQLVHPKQMLITPLSVYYGMAGAFVFTEATRAFASCVLGVSTVGVCAILFATFNGLFCFLCGRYLGPYGRFPLIASGFIIEMTIYLFCLLWEPTQTTSWLVYLLFAMFGIGGGSWQMLLSTHYGSSFYKTKEISFTIWGVTFSSGFALQSAISTLLCVREKIYILMTCLIVGALLAVYLEWSNKREGVNKQKSNSTSIHSAEKY